MPKLITKCPLRKIISGGQTGADIAGLKAAKMLGLNTGGWMPKGWKTLDGCMPEYSNLYGMRECLDPGYPPRTSLNVLDSDGTVRFASDFNSPGERCTLKFITQHGRPSFDVSVYSEANELFSFCSWLRDESIEILNVAGNSERTCPGIERFVIGFLLLALWDSPYAQTNH